jgi:hypothetical protein
MRGQSAIEYLMTYGWAILALVIIIGVLVSTGILSPTYLISEECTLGSNLPCNLALYNQGGVTKLALGLRDGFAYKIKITDIKVYSTTDSSHFTGFSVPATMDSGGSVTFNGSMAGQLPATSIARFYANITYESCAPELVVPPNDCSDANHTIVGRITGRVIQG